jgi:hypothetical protein
MTTPDTGLDKESPRSWLDQWPPERRSLLANIFCHAVRTGATTPDGVLAGVGNDVLRRVRWEPDPACKTHFQAVLTALMEDRAGALAYAGEILHWETLSSPEKRLLKAQRAKVHIFAYMAGKPVTERQQAFLASLGYQGAAPANRPAASALIDSLLARQRGGADPDARRSSLYNAARSQWHCRRGHYGAWLSFH